MGPEPEPEPEPEAATPAPVTPSPAPVTTPIPPVSTPAPPVNGMTCTATPGLNRGVTDAACAKCATGYKWWPCNEAALCECTGTALAQFGTEIEPMKRTAIKNRMRKHSFLAPNV